MGARSLSVSEEFRQFTWGVEHKMTSPYYPQSNGIAENGVKIVKRLHRKVVDRGEDAYLALLAYTGRQPTEERMPTSPCLLTQEDSRQRRGCLPRLACLHRKTADRGEDAYLALLAYTGRQSTEERMLTSPCLLTQEDSRQRRGCLPRLACLHRKTVDRGEDAYLALLAYTGRQPTGERMPTSPCLRIPLHPSTVESVRPSYCLAERSERG